MEKIRTCLSNNDWAEKFNNLHVDEMVKVFSSVFIIIDDRYPTWITCDIKTAVKRKHRVFNRHVKGRRKPEHWECVKQVTNATCRMITSARETYFKNLGEKLSDPSKGIN